MKKPAKKVQKSEASTAPQFALVEIPEASSAPSADKEGDAFLKWLDAMPSHPGEMTVTVPVKCDVMEWSGLAFAAKRHGLTVEHIVEGLARDFGMTIANKADHPLPSNFPAYKTFKAA